MCETIISWGNFFFFWKCWFLGSLRGLVGGVGSRVKEQKMVQNDKKSYLSHSVPQEQYVIWLWFLVHMYKMISPGIFIVSKFLSFGFLGGKRVKTDLKVPISVCWTVYLFPELLIISSRFLVRRCKKLTSPGVFLILLKECNIANIKIILFFIGPLQQFFVINICFSSSSVNAKKKFWDVPQLLHICAIFIAKKNLHMG